MRASAIKLWRGDRDMFYSVVVCCSVLSCVAVYCRVLRWASAIKLWRGDRDMFFQPKKMQVGTVCMYVYLCVCVWARERESVCMCIDDSDIFFQRYVAKNCRVLQCVVKFNIIHKCLYAYTWMYIYIHTYIYTYMYVCMYTRRGDREMYFFLFKNASQHCLHVFVCVCVCERERERESVCVCRGDSDIFFQRYVIFFQKCKLALFACVCMCVCVSECVCRTLFPSFLAQRRSRHMFFPENVSQHWVYVCACVCVCVCKWVCVHVYVYVCV